MSNQGATVGTMFGMSATLTTNTTLMGDIRSVGTAPEMSRKSIETTTSGVTGGWETFAPGDKLNPGMLEVTCNYNTQLDYATLFATGCDTITVTFPKRATTCGGSLAATAATWVSACVLEKISPKWEFEDLNLVTFTFKLSGKATYTAAVA